MAGHASFDQWSTLPPLQEKAQLRAVMAGKAWLQHDFRRDGSCAARLTLRLRNCSDAAVSVCVEAGASQQSAGAIPMHADILHASMQPPMLAIYCMDGQPQAQMSCLPPIACVITCRLLPAMR